MNAVADPLNACTRTRCRTADQPSGMANALTRHGTAVQGSFGNNSVCSPGRESSRHAWCCIQRMTGGRAVTAGPPGPGRRGRGGPAPVPSTGAPPRLPPQCWRRLGRRSGATAAAPRPQPGQPASPPARSHAGFSGRRHEGLPAQGMAR